MPNISNAMYQMNHIENMSRKNTVIHRMEPAVKLLITVIYLVVVISVRPYQVSGLLPFVFYPVVTIILAEISIKPLLHTLVIAVPFTFFAGLSNLLLNREIAMYILNIGITEGMLSFCSVLLKSILTVMAVLILIATTSMNDLLYAMLYFKVPEIIVIQVMMTYRYISVLGAEAVTMYHAYLLRAPKEKGVKLKDMGPFLGQLIIRSFDRAERIYSAMQCRGFEGNITFSRKANISQRGWLCVFVIGGLFIAVRLVNVSELLGRLLI